ncbi:TPA: hypothetical protein HA244_03795 [Candidatus Micrarchaeota archaeon]|nr:hypothetical protein [Candidatus Micrarchaeota archaeon]
MVQPSKLSVLKGYYISAHSRRRDFYNWKWRVFLIFLAVLTVLFVNDYLQAKYVDTAVNKINADGSITAAPYAIADRLFYWFMTGVLFGVVALAVLNEGEFILGLRRMVRSLAKGERQAESRAGRLLGKMGSTLSGGKRKKVKQRTK